MDPAP